MKNIFNFRSPHYYGLLRNIVWVIFLLNVTFGYSQQIECSTSLNERELVEDIIEQALCDEPSCLYVSFDQENAPIITIRINVHILERGFGNFYNGEIDNWDRYNGWAVAKSMVTHFNEIASNIPPRNLDVYPLVTSFVGDSKFRVELYSNPAINPGDTKEGVFYYNSPLKIAPPKQYPNVLDVVIYNETPEELIGRGLSIRGDYETTEIYIKNLYSVMRVNPQDINLGGWSIAQVLFHEIGHITLNHSWEDSYCQGEFIPDFECHAEPCGNTMSNNLMAYGGGHSLSKRQHYRFYITLLKTFNANTGPFISIEPSDFCATANSDLVIKNGETLKIENQTYIPSGNIRVEPGGEFVLNCSILQMKADAKIIIERGAKAFLTNSDINSYCGSDRLWGGIFVHGNTSRAHPDNIYSTLALDDPGILYVNKCNIKNVSTAISTSSFDGTYDEQKVRWGGLVHIINSNFYGCRRGIEFMQYKFPNKSFIFSNSFAGSGFNSINTVGITIWDCNGITIKNNTFTFLKNAGILGFDFTAEIADGNTFQNNNVGIKMYGTYISPGEMKIGKVGTSQNVFSGQTSSDIYINAAVHYLRSRIENNQFNSGIQAIWIDGTTNYFITHNLFRNYDKGIILTNTSSAYDNFIRCNTFDKMRFFSINAQGNNGSDRGIQFFRNHFLSGEYNILVDEYGSNNGAVRNEIGSVRFGSNNCFNFIPSDEFEPYTTTLGLYAARANRMTSSFTYYATTDNPNLPCYKPLSNLSDLGEPIINNYRLIWGLDEDNCNDPNINFVKQENCNITNLQRIKQRVNELESNKTLSPEQKLELELSQEEYDLVRSILFDKAIKDQSWSMASEILILMTTADPFYNSYKHALLIGQDNFQEASTLVSLNQNSEDQTKNTCQLLNLKSISSTTAMISPKLTEDDFETLNQISNSKHKDRALARSILAFQKGIYFEPDDEFNPNNFKIIEKRSFNPSEDLDSKQISNIYPNPFNETIHLDGSLFENFGEHSEISISNILGIMLYSKEIKSTDFKNLDINTKSWPSGTYYLTIKGLKGQKIVKSLVKL